MTIADRIKPGIQALDLLEILYSFHDIRLLEIVRYICEEKPHFDEAKAKNPRAKRSVAKALQHTPDFVQPTHFIQQAESFTGVRKDMAELKEIDPNQVEIASYVPEGDKRPRVHEALKVVSRVRTKNGVFHIPLLDLDIPVDEGGAASAEEVFVNLGIRSGAVLDSGKSYHAWGLELLPDKDWHDFMYKALLLDRIDRRWVGHRLIDGHANLRISEKRKKVPTVVHVF